MKKDLVVSRPATSEEKDRKEMASLPKLSCLKFYLESFSVTMRLLCQSFVNLSHASPVEEQPCLGGSVITLAVKRSVTLHKSLESRI